MPMTAAEGFSSRIRKAGRFWKLVYPDPKSKELEKDETLQLLIQACHYCDDSCFGFFECWKKDVRPEWRREAGRLLDSIFGVGCWDKRKPINRHHQRIVMRPIRRELRKEDKKMMRRIKREMADEEKDR